MFWGAFVSLLYYDTTASLYNSQMFTILMRGCYVTDHSWNDPLDSEVACSKDSSYSSVSTGWIGIKNNGFCGGWKMG